MAGVRVIVTMEYVSPDAAEAAVAGLRERFAFSKTEEGVVQYELFRGLDDPAKIVLHEHWATQELYDKHWLAQTQRQTKPRQPDPSRKATTFEFYRHEEFQLVDGVWQAKDPSLRSITVRWI